MEKDLIKLSIEDGIAHVCLNRPSKINALSYDMFVAIDKVIKKLRGDKGVNAVILSGAEGNFCSGLDVKSVANSPSKAMKLLFKWLPGNANLAQRVSIGWQRLPIPVIAVLEGCCYGGGTQIALGADIRIASPDCKLSIMEAKWGLVPDMAGLVALRQVMPKDKALLLTYTADILTAGQALELGLISQVCETPYETAVTLARKIMLTSPDANAAIKRCINQSWTGSIRCLLARESLSQIRLLAGKNRVIAAIRQTKNPDKAYQSRQSWW
ncbi:crotonase/enoyl-CoA hydratase family protein [Shewanella inventionis]|uniref:Enoyl-CoA hydratase n=1 Tax=Shewanella inventionis TaxID=1738770 RepID=A0ABQ1IMB5_9GAMM|nr:crotonase/enoyl-CoA hydratase family protein [Shewanella inventionis]MCL1156557.1 crotonase/enoyl-CoA hydratase family protein [Shewanella inventionis]UAL44250.1 crotonase/enoyl-CoA hydratase family protein [Shewanella inventionis]GGB46436.1 enoyl-CoA hydratase [Shewanella inventionis]